MAEKENALMGVDQAPPKINRLKLLIKVFIKRKIVLFSLIVIIAFILVAIFATLITPYNPYKPDLTNALQQPSSTHLLGTDAIGRDTLSRIIFGSRRKAFR